MAIIARMATMIPRRFAISSCIFPVASILLGCAVTTARTRDAQVTRGDEVEAVDEAPVGTAFGSPTVAMAQRLAGVGVRWLVMQRSSRAPFDEGPFAAAVLRVGENTYVCNGVLGTEDCVVLPAGLDTTGARLSLGDWEGHANVVLGPAGTLAVPLPDADATELRAVDGTTTPGPALRRIDDEDFTTFDPLGGLEVIRSDDGSFFAVRDQASFWLCTSEPEWRCATPVSDSLSPSMVLTEVQVAGTTWQVLYEDEEIASLWTAGSLFFHVSPEGTATQVFRLITDAEHRTAPVDGETEVQHAVHHFASLSGPACLLISEATVSDGVSLAPATALAGSMAPDDPFTTGLQGAWRLTSSGLERVDDCPP